MNGRNLSLHVTDAFDETLDDLARQTGLTKGEVIREAVILLNESHKAIRDGAHLGVAGGDVLMEFDYDELYAPVDLRIGHCRLSVAGPAAMAAEDDPAEWSFIRIATKYPNVTRKHFAARGVHAECVKLNGAVELAPALGLCRRIVDLVSTGATLKANGLEEMETIAEVTSRLAVNRPALKTRPDAMSALIERLRDAAGG